MEFERVIDDALDVDLVRLGRSVDANDAVLERGLAVDGTSDAVATSSLWSSSSNSVGLLAIVETDSISALPSMS
jgi:hypothetical protein